MSSNYVSSIISLVRSGNKTIKGDKISAITTVGHAAKVIEKVAKLQDTGAGKIAGSIVDTLTMTAETNPAVNILGKGLKIAKKADAIGCARSAVKTFKSETPARTLIEESSSWGAKFFVKGLWLKNINNFQKNTKGVNKVTAKIYDFSKSTKGCGQIPALISGVGYSLATIYAPKVGRKIGAFVADKLGLAKTENTQSSPSKIPK